MGDEAMDNIELMKSDRDLYWKRGRTEWMMLPYPLVIPTDDLRAHLVPR
jgi:hypothetical protein